MWTTSRILLGGALLSAAVAAQPLRPMVVVGPSMSPTYASGQVLWTVPVDRPLRRGDVVVAEGPDGPVVKRVALLAGDRRQQWRDRSGWTDTTVFNVPRRPSARTQARLRNTVVPSGTVFLLGDNLDRSVDSRTFGPVPIDRVLRLVVGARQPDARSDVADRAARHWIASAILSRSL